MDGFHPWATQDQQFIYDDIEHATILIGSVSSVLIDSSSIYACTDETIQIFLEDYYVLHIYIYICIYV